MEREAPDQVDDEHTVRQQRGEVYHLRAPEGTREQSQPPGDPPTGPLCPWDRPVVPIEHSTLSPAQATDGWKGRTTGSESGLGSWRTGAFACLCNCQEMCVRRPEENG